MTAFHRESVFEQTLGVSKSSIPTRLRLRTLMVLLKEVAVSQGSFDAASVASLEAIQALCDVVQIFVFS